MDLLEEIRRKTTLLSSHPALDGVNAVLRHVEVAERYLSRARAEREEDLFNDVIYRTNQAFEGMLKEAYSVLTDSDGSKLSPHQIEQHLLDSKALASRVLDLFTNYRQKWRNPSTHDYKLFFGEQEALLAIVSVSAFASILLDQIIERINFKREQEEVKRKKNQLQPNIKSSEVRPLYEEVITLLKLFGEDSLASPMDTGQLREIEVIGRLHAFLESLYPESNVVREPIVSGHREFRPDLLIQKKGEEVIVELKLSGKNRSALENGAQQVITYLQAGNWRHGILFIHPSAGDKVETATRVIDTEGRRITVHIVAPGRLL